MSIGTMLAKMNKEKKETGERTRNFYKHDVMQTIFLFLTQKKLFEVQLVCRLFYDYHVPESSKVLDLGALFALQRMLETEPAGSYVKVDILEMWRKMLPLTVSQFRRYWQVAEARMSDGRKMINTD